MKKSIIYISIALALICVLGAAWFFLHNNTKEPANTSRRDGMIIDSSLSGDEDLLAVSGESISDLENVTDKDSEKERERIEADSALLSSIQETEATSPTSEEVESVEVVLIPEAVLIEDGDEAQFYAEESFLDVVPDDAISFSADEIPVSYDSRDVNGKSYVTAVKDQGYTYLCWTYVAMGAMESDILKHDDSLTPSDINLSEKHLSFYNMHRAEGSYGGYTDGDFREFVNADNEEGAWIFEYDTNYVSAGGVNDYCISLLTAWKGPVSEKDNNAFTSIYGRRHIFEDNSEKPSDAYASEYHVQDVIELPAYIDNSVKIKQLIMEHGCVTAGVCAEKKFFGRNKTTLYSEYGDGEIAIADHEILIIGWDDEYPASNFAIKPPADGAWICKNSWGETFGDKGFFYLSYYDQTLCSNNVAAYSVAKEKDGDWYDHNYQAAGFLTFMTNTLDDDDNYVTAYSASRNPYGISYTAQSDELLKAIGLMAIETYRQYEIEVYINPEFTDADGKDDSIGKNVKKRAVNIGELGKPDVSFEASSISGGYHTFELPKELELSAGDEFFVLIRPVTAAKLVYENDIDAVSKPNYDEWKNLTGNVHNHYEASGCSYYVSEDGKSFVQQNDKDFFVKAYTCDRE